jgi:hypothetical protein
MGLHCLISQKVDLFIDIAVIISNPTYVEVSQLGIREIELLTEIPVLANRKRSKAIPITGL